MAQKNIKLEDVARKAGVSLTTASLVLSDRGRISEATKARVLEAAHDLGYHHKARRDQDSAQSRRRDVAILLDIGQEWTMASLLVRPIIQHMEIALEDAGLNTILVPITRHESTSELIEKIRAIGVAGVASIHFASPELILFLESAGIPVVVVMNSSYQDRFSTVCADDYQGAYEGTTCLIKAGHLRLGYVDCVRPDLPGLPVDRFFGFSKAIEEYHLTFDQTMRRRLTLKDDASDREALSDLLKEHPDITALFALDDDAAARIAASLARLGYQVPRDISMIAPGDMLDYSLNYVLPLTTMRIDTTYMGTLAAQMMIERLTEGTTAIRVLKVKQQIMRRGSVRKLTDLADDEERPARS